MLEVWDSGGPPTDRLLPFIAGSASVRAPVVTPIARALQQAKSEIDLYYEEGRWDDYKKITNPYEYIFLSWNRRSSKSVATRQPLSRSYFKMIELWRRLDLNAALAPLVATGGLRTAHAAEGPGGFIEACAEMSRRNGWRLSASHAITLQSEAKNVPGWRKAVTFLEMFPQIAIHNGADGTGNILRVANQDAFVETVGGSAHLYTADGGFDFSSDYNAQEDSIFPLLLAETLIGLKVLARGGCLIIKCFDTNEQPTRDLIWLTTQAFATWGVIKPRTSRAGNAERYIVGKGFLGRTEIGDIITILENYQDAGAFANPLLAETIHSGESYKAIMRKLFELQEIIERVEIGVINETLGLIKHTDATQIKTLVRANVERSIVWCTEHEEPISPQWITELDRNVIRETSELQHILNPGNVLTYSGWNPRINSSNLLFTGFRTDAGMTPPSQNPFMRVKSAGGGASV
jgi:23S rRNA U2552 (ribose-2'-O)-methylase RlmE/FtsJ